MKDRGKAIPVLTQPPAVVWGAKKSLGSSQAEAPAIPAAEPRFFYPRTESKEVGPMPETITTFKDIIKKSRPKKPEGDERIES